MILASVSDITCYSLGLPMKLHTKLILTLLVFGPNINIISLLFLYYLVVHYSLLFRFLKWYNIFCLKVMRNMIPFHSDGCPLILSVDWIVFFYYDSIFWDKNKSNAKNPRLYFILLMTQLRVRVGGCSRIKNPAREVRWKWILFS